MMIKLYCDRCGKECSHLIEIKIPTEKTIGGFATSDFMVCGECKKEYNDVIDKLTDIRFVMFRGFMKGGGGDD